MTLGVVLRSCLFALFQIFITPIFAIIALLTFPFAPLTRYRVITVWSRLTIAAARAICGIRYRVLGAENIPPEPCIFLSKHQSAWETLAFQAILPPHVLVHPVNHGGRIIDWSYAVEARKDRIKAISKPYRDFYAPEILGKFMPVPATDIYMAVKTTIVMLGGTPVGDIPGNVPKALAGFLTSCLAKAPERRPHDA